MSAIPVKRTVQTDPLTLADLLERLGNIVPKRVLIWPPPGEAREQNVLDVHAREKRLCELVDGVLVEKVMGFAESFLACIFIRLLGNFADKRNLGIVTGPDGMVRLAAGLVRIPDVSFVSWDRLPNREVPAEPIPTLAPDLAVEVLSEGNTPEEMARKLREYFRAGVRLVWFVDPRTRTVEVYTAPDQCVVLTEEQTLDGGGVLPGFTLPLRTLFARVPRRANKSAKGKNARPPAKKKPKKK